MIVIPYDGIAAVRQVTGRHGGPRPAGPLRLPDLGRLRRGAAAQLGRQDAQAHLARALPGEPTLPADAVAPLTDEHNSLPPPDAFHLPVGRAVTHKIYRDALHQSGLVLPFTTRGTELPGPFD
jgi:hypothetical protein